MIAAAIKDGGDVTAAVNPAPASTPAVVDTAFGDLDETVAPVQPAAPTFSMAADTGEDADVGLDGRVADLLANMPATNWNAVSAFMANVVAWPGPNDPGHVGLWFSMPNQHFDPAKPFGFKNKSTFMTGWPFKDVDQFVAAAGRMNNQPERYKHVYFCTSRQGKQNLNKLGHPKAQKSAAGALYQKSIFIDIDIEPNNPKHYATHDEAWNEFAALRKKVGLPGPSAVVNTGGGLHIYWISKTPLLPDEWHPYANGLKQLLLANNFKFDPTCTGDIARLLRVPGTSNHKYDPPKEAQLLPLPLKLYDFTVLDFLKQHAGQTPARTARAHQLFDDAADRDSFKAGPAFKIEGEPDLQAGIDKFGDSLLDPLPIFKQCGFYREALLNGGKNNDNPQWNLAILGTIFMEDGNNIAHRISKDHPTYTPSDTDAMFDRKTAERRDRGLGYPQCSTIQGAGCTSCATCPLLEKVRSPLNIGPAVTATVNPVGAPVPTKAGTVAVRFRDFNQFGRPKPSLANAVIAIRALGIEVSYDLFHNRVNVKNNGKSTTIQEGLLTDHTVGAVRSLINNAFRIDCGDANTFSAIKEIAWDNAFDPVLDLLDECQGNWDGVKRLDTWVIDYLGCEDTRLNRAIGRAVLEAACRRARKPGCKFDFITVLEGPEGINKSTAIRVLAGDEYFSDQSILGASDKEVQEQLEGTWMHENADLAGMRRAEVEQVKAFASRQVDRARPAYSRVREDRPRRSIEWATTNNEEYLLSQTGNRRWWPLKTVKVDIEALKRDREQLLGEAATYEAAGEHIGLDESLWSDARNVQEQRRVTDPWEDALANLDGHSGIVHRLGDGVERVFSVDLLTYVLVIPKSQQTSQHMQRLALAMKHLGWGRSENGRITIGGVTLRGYVRAIPFSGAQRFAHPEMGIEEPPPEPVSTGICAQLLTGLTHLTVIPWSFSARSSNRIFCTMAAARKAYTLRQGPSGLSGSTNTGVSELTDAHLGYGI